MSIPILISQTSIPYVLRKAECQDAEFLQTIGTTPASRFPDEQPCQARALPTKPVGVQVYEVRSV
jgi:hypothetical protein